MKLNFKKITSYFTLLFFLLIFEGNTKNPPNTFADLAENLMPSVVNISTTTTIKTQANPFPFQFPPGSPFGEMFKEFDKPTERKASSLGSGFIIKKKWNHNYKQSCYSKCRGYNWEVYLLHLYLIQL